MSDIVEFLKEQKVKETGAFSKGVNKGLNIAISAIKNPEICPTIEQPQWISCAERLPAESGYYLVMYRDKFNGSKLVSIDFYTKCTAGEWWDNDFGRTAIYWMPLPQPPEGDE